MNPVVQVLAYDQVVRKIIVHEVLPSPNMAIQEGQNRKNVFWQYHRWSNEDEVQISISNRKFKFTMISMLPNKNVPAIRCNESTIVEN